MSVVKMSVTITSDLPPAPSPPIHLKHFMCCNFTKAVQLYPSKIKGTYAVIIRIRMSCSDLQTATPEICIVKWMRSNRVVELTDSKGATVLGSIPVSSDAVESEGWY
jgi:hypothetical protein